MVFRILFKDKLSRGCMFPIFNSDFHFATKKGFYVKTWATLYTGIYDPDKKSSWAVQGYL